MSLTELQNFFDQFAAEWDYHFKPDRLQRLHQIVAQNLSFLKSPILDLGCGTGILLEVFRQELKTPPERIVELDIAMNMLKQIDKRKNHFPLPFFPVQADGQHIPLKANTMGSVVAFQVYPHFLQPKQVVNEVFRVLKPNGFFAVLHLDDHQTLNDRHRSLHPIVQNHQLPPANVLQKFLEQHGFLRIKSAEHKGLYFVLVQKPLY